MLRKLLISLAILLPSVALAQDRLALAVGIDEYQNVADLREAANDAQTVSKVLYDIGFEVTTITDVDKRTFKRDLDQFTFEVEPGDEVVFYHARHSIEIDGLNYLLPSDAPDGASERTLRSDNIDADQVLYDLQSAGASAAIMIPDACRDNPYAQPGRSLGSSRVLNTMVAPEGSFVSLSAASAQVALESEDSDPNSIFTRALLPLLQEPGLRLPDLTRCPRSDVQRFASVHGGSQRPDYYNELAGQFLFMPEAQASPGSPVENACHLARAEWDYVNGSGDQILLEEFIRQHTDCRLFTRLAGLQVDKFMVEDQEFEPKTVYRRSRSDPAVNSSDLLARRQTHPRQREEGNALRRGALDIQVDTNLPLISIIVIDRSGSGLPLSEVVTYPAPLTVALDPTQPGAIEASEGYAASGHEVLMLANSFPSNAAPLAAAAALTQLLKQMPAAVGVLLPPGSPFVRDATHASELTALLAHSGHGLVSLPQGIDALGHAMATADVPDVKVFRVLDSQDEGVPLMTRYMDRAALHARIYGAAVVLGIVQPKTMEALNQWLGRRLSDTVVLAPISKVMLQEFEGETVNRPPRRDPVVNSSDLSARIETRLRQGEELGDHSVPYLNIATQASAPTFRYLAQYTISDRRGEMRLQERKDGSLVEIASFSYTDGLPEAYADLVNRNVPINYRITVAEGVTSWNIVEALKNADFLSGDTPEELPREGKLAPDTYEVAKGTSRADVLRRMEAAQESILAEAWELRAHNLPISSQDEALILASIIEKETSAPDERRLFASVFTNRLRRGMRLQTDPTVIYGITQGQGTLDRALRVFELQRVTPWNTYTINGLPPTPITNPGRAAIEAALNPDATDYIFFVADGTGGHAFAATLSEHNTNVARWRQIESERAN